MIYDFTSVNDTSDSIPFCEGGIDSRHKHTHTHTIYACKHSCRIMPYPHRIRGQSGTPRMADMCWSYKSNTILPKNTKKTHPASPKTSLISGSSAKKTSGGLERSELGLEVRWLDGSIGWLDGWISIGSTHIYLYLSDLSIPVYLQSYELDLDALLCWEIPLFF